MKPYHCVFVFFSWAPLGADGSGEPCWEMAARITTGKREVNIIHLLCLAERLPADEEGMEIPIGKRLGAGGRGSYSLSFSLGWHLL